MSFREDLVVSNCTYLKHLKPDYATHEKEIILLCCEKRNVLHQKKEI